MPGNQITRCIDEIYLVDKLSKGFPVEDVSLSQNKAGDYILNENVVLPPIQTKGRVQQMNGWFGGVECGDGKSCASNAHENETRLVQMKFERE